ncbi:MAG: iron chelate uptake ABC transporter family permease subunit [Planctomycetota bacterium]
MINLSLTDKVMIGTALLGGMSGVVGSFAVLRGRSLVGDMLAHAALPGICLAFLVIGTKSLLGLSAGALLSGLLAIVAVTSIVRWTRTKEDAAIGIVLSTFFGAGVVLLSLIQKPGVGGSKAGLDSYLFGEPGNMLTGDLVVLAVVGVAVLATVGLLFKEFELVCFDSDFAQSQGWPTLRLDLFMMASLAVVTIVGLPIVGVILMTAMIILPAATARLWTNRLRYMLQLAAAFGLAAGLLGTWLGRDLPAGAAIVLTAAAFFVLSILFAPQRGIVSRLMAEYRYRKRIEREHLLRSLYELGEGKADHESTIELQALRDYRYWRSLTKLLEQAADEGEVNLTQQVVELTPLGQRRAARLTKAHRLWELYMVQHVGIASDHVDRDADDVEHMLPEGLLIELEQKLASEGRLPEVAQEVPLSPHQLDSPSSEPPSEPSS